MKQNKLGFGDVNGDRKVQNEKNECDNGGTLECREFSFRCRFGLVHIDLVLQQMITAHHMV